MACGARSGLKLCKMILQAKFYRRRNGLWSPFGIETLCFRFDKYPA